MKKALKTLFVGLAILFTFSVNSYGAPDYVINPLYLKIIRSYTKPDFKVKLITVNRFNAWRDGHPVKDYHIYAYIKNYGGNMGLSKDGRMPVNLHVSFHPSTTTGDTEEEDTLMMDVPRAGETKYAHFYVEYRDDGPGGYYRKIPWQFAVTADQWHYVACHGDRYPGLIDEIEECNNDNAVNLSYVAEDPTMCYWTSD
jgi:hypothetical protein